MVGPRPERPTSSSSCSSRSRSSRSASRSSRASPAGRRCATSTARRSRTRSKSTSTTCTTSRTTRCSSTRDPVRDRRGRAHGQGRPLTCGSPERGPPWRRNAPPRLWCDERHVRRRPRSGPGLLCAALLDLRRARRAAGPDRLPAAAAGRRAGLPGRRGLQRRLGCGRLDRHWSARPGLAAAAGPGRPGCAMPPGTSSCWCCCGRPSVARAARPGGCAPWRWRWWPWVRWRSAWSCCRRTTRCAAGPCSPRWRCRCSACCWWSSCSATSRATAAGAPSRCAWVWPASSATTSTSTRRRCCSAASTPMPSHPCRHP
jgi:hypothetical protein